MRRNGTCSLAWYTVSDINVRNNTITIKKIKRNLYVCPEKTCEHIRNVWLASLGTVIAAWNRVRLVNARRGVGLLDFEGSGMPISVATWPASPERGWLGMGRLMPPRKQKKLDRPTGCVAYVCLTRLVLRFTNHMLRALPVTPFSPCDAPGISRYPHPEGERCIMYQV